MFPVAHFPSLMPPRRQVQRGTTDYTGFADYRVTPVTYTPHMPSKSIFSRSSAKSHSGISMGYSPEKQAVQ